MENWTEKYRPRTLKDIIGNHQALGIMRKWGHDWHQGTAQKKALILCGGPGMGKTSAALALAHDQGWESIELNASDARNETIIKKIALAGGINETFTMTGEYASSKKGKNKLIILDEADNLYEREGDRGGKRAIVDTIKRTHQPIILIVNDYYALVKKNLEIRRLSHQVQFQGGGNLSRLLEHICIQENITVAPEVIKAITHQAQGDIRSAINDLQSLCQGRTHVAKEACTQLSTRDRKSELFQGIRKILKARNITHARRAARELGETPEFLALWIDENLPREYRDTQDLYRGFRYLSAGDVFLGRARKYQHYHLWSYAHDLLSGGVAVAKKRYYPGFTRYSFPTWLTEMGKSRNTRAVRDSIAKKLGRECHMSIHKTRAFLPFFQKLVSSDAQYAAHMTHLLELTDQEVLFLLGSDRTKYKEIRQEKKHPEKKPKPEKKKNEKDTRASVPGKKTSQQRLHDFQ